ncbi:MAG: hypothetical protein WCT10_05475 [Patescibacteria group bacterium]|jgi:hypothetical protein
MDSKEQNIRPEAKLNGISGQDEIAAERAPAREEDLVELDLNDLEQGMELPRAETEFELQLRAAEREVREASEAFMKTISELLAKIEQAPLGVEIRAAIEESPDNLRLKRAIDHLDDLRQEQAIIRAVADTELPEAAIELTDDMIIGYQKAEAPTESADKRELPPPLPLEALREVAGQPAENELGLAALKNAASVDSLKSAVKTLGRIKDERGKSYSADQLNEMIDRAIKYPILLNTLTRANGLREKVRELIASSNQERHEALKTEYAAELAASGDLTAPEKEAAAGIIAKNELPPARRAALEAEVQELHNRLYDIQKGATIIDKKTGESEERPGLERLEKALAALGVNANELLEKQAVSGWERFKFGLKTLVRPELDRTVKQYQELLRNQSEAQEVLALAELELKNPRKYAALARQRLARTLLTSTTVNSQRQAASNSGAITMKF